MTFKQDVEARQREARIRLYECPYCLLVNQLIGRDELTPEEETSLLAHLWSKHGLRR
jgi:hypothetical protein